MKSGNENKYNKFKKMTIGLINWVAINRSISLKYCTARTFTVCLPEAIARQLLVVVSNRRPHRLCWPAAGKRPPNSSNNIPRRRLPLP